MKNKIHKYDFLIVGAGLIGTITALALVKKKFRVLVIDKKNNILEDNRTLAVNANSIDFLKQLGIWNNLKSTPQPIDKIIIKDDISRQPLIFENDHESMGNVIFNKDLYELVKKKLLNLKILKIYNNFEVNDLSPNKGVFIDKKNYVFKKIIISIGKNIISNTYHKSIIFNQQQFSYVGFFKHSKEHDNTAYEFFTNHGPLAVLPSPAVNKKKSTFIYSSKQKINKIELQKLINAKIISTHGKLIFDQSIQKFPIIPHLIKKNDKFIYVGDSLKSIHPVAGQGWNLGVKDIQTLCKIIDQYSIDAKKLNTIYYSRRMFESTIYFSFTSLLNFLYENNISINKKIIKAGYTALKNFKFVRDVFIKQAMGRINLID
tara:strand:- start:2425 stop:3546 length:1122 start_codon:yes stop_codon:yes gene_type:complete